MSKSHKRKNAEYLQKKRCVLCGRNVYPFERDYLTGSTGRVVCRECLGLTKRLPERLKSASQNNTPAAEQSILPPQEIIRQLDKSIIGQDKAKRAMAIALWKQQLRAAGNTSVPRSNLLLYGPTGCGKTALVQAAAEIVGLPFLMFDATTFTETGYRGRDAADMVNDLMSRFPDHPKRSFGIVFLDEIDKLAAKGSDIRVQYNRGTQHTLLKLIEGTEVKTDSGFFSTDSLLFIFGGAFTGLGKHAEKQPIPIGFARKVELPVTCCNINISTESFVHFGMEPELMGRVGQYVPLSALTADMLRQILFQSELSVYRKYRQFFSGYGIQLELSDDYADRLVSDALALQTGARGLNHLLEEAMEPLLFRLAAGTLPKTVYLKKGAEPDAV